MASLYELTGSVLKLNELLLEGELDEEMIRGALENANEDIAIKLENYAKFMKNLESDIEGLKKEEKRLHDKKEVLENTIARMKSAMMDAMILSGQPKIKRDGSLFSFTIQKNPASVVLDTDSLDDIPEEYLIPQEPKVNKKAMMEDLKNGKALKGIAHLVQTASLRIR